MHEVGDIIVRKSYQKDMKFTIVKIINHQAILERFKLSA